VLAEGCCAISGSPFGPGRASSTPGDHLGLRLGCAATRGASRPSRLNRNTKRSQGRGSNGAKGLAVDAGRLQKRQTCGQRPRRLFRALLQAHLMQAGARGGNRVPSEVGDCCRANVFRRRWETQAAGNGHMSLLRSVIEGFHHQIVTSCLQHGRSADQCRYADRSCRARDIEQVVVAMAGGGRTCVVCSFSPGRALPGRASPVGGSEVECEIERRLSMVLSEPGRPRGWVVRRGADRQGQNAAPEALADRWSRASVVGSRPSGRPEIKFRASSR